MTRIRLGNAIICGLVLIAAVAAVGINAAESPKKIRIIYTGDMLGHVEPCG